MISDVGDDFGVLPIEGRGKKNNDTNNCNGKSDSSNKNSIVK